MPPSDSHKCPFFKRIGMSHGYDEKLCKQRFLTAQVSTDAIGNRKTESYG